MLILVGLMIIQAQLLYAQPGVKWINGEPYVALRDMARYYGMEYRHPDSKTIQLGSRWSSLKFNLKSRISEINGVQVWLHEGLRKYHGDWILSRADAQRIIDPLLRSKDHLKNNSPATIVLDPGHGGKDKGAIGSRNVQEKLAALDIAKRTRKHLKRLGIKALLTREGDKFISLNERTKLAARWNADLFVSIHLNSSASPSANGVECYVLTSPGFRSTNAKSRKRIKRLRYPGTAREEESTVAGFMIQKNLLAQTGAEDRGMREGRFYVLKHNICPTVLVECAFLSNSREQNKVLKASYRDNIAKGIALGIADYVNAYRRAQLH